jgi:hypothetical protein
MLIAPAREVNWNQLIGHIAHDLVEVREADEGFKGATAKENPDRTEKHVDIPASRTGRRITRMTSLALDRSVWEHRSGFDWSHLQ